MFVAAVPLFVIKPGTGDTPVPRIRKVAFSLRRLRCRYLHVIEYDFELGILRYQPPMNT